VKVTADIIEKLDKTLHGLKWQEQHGATVLSAEVEVEGEVFSVSRDYESYDEEGNHVPEGVLAVDFE
jgi:hypothetical protein